MTTIKGSTNTKHFSSGSACPPTTQDLLRLYSMSFCPFSQRTRIVLNAKKVQYELVNINLKNKPEWFLELNPLGKTPALEINGKIMYDSLITCDYLNEAYPNPPLYPSDPWAKGVDKCLIEAFGLKVVSSYYKVYCNPKESEEIIPIAEKVRQGLDTFEKELKERSTTYFGGSQPGMLDYVMFPWFERFPVVQKVFPDFDILSEDRFPLLTEYVIAMHQDEAAFSSLSVLDHHVNFFKGVLEGNPDYDIGIEI